MFEDSRHPFEAALAVHPVDLDLSYLGVFEIFWQDFLLNPRRLRGSDFLMRKVPIHVWHVFFERAYGLAFDAAKSLIKEGLIQETVQVFQAPGGATSKKGIYKFYHQYAYLLGTSTQDPTLVSQFIEDKNGHILPYVTFQGGELAFAKEALEKLEAL